jgi:hypothetical protein
VALTTCCTGFEFGTTAGWATGNTGNKIFDTITGTCTVVTTTPRTGTYCGRINVSAAAGAIRWSTNTIGSSKTFGRVVFAVLLESLPSADTILACFTANSNIEFRYQNSSGKFQLLFESDTAATGPSVTAGQWYVIEIYVDYSGTAQTADWWVDTVSQTQATHTAGAADAITEFNLGAFFVTQTFTARYDDVVIWTDTASISGPKGKHKVQILSVDPSGTFTVNGATTNWNTFSGATPTESAWDATTARNNTDEIPINIGSSQDGFQQIVNSTTTYVECPLTTYTLAAGESVAAARMLAAGWAASTTAASIGFRSWNGTTETTLFASADPNFDNSATVPAWVCKMLTLADVDTQSEIDALAIRVGFSGDTSPHIELAVQESTSSDATATPSVVSAVAAVPAPTFVGNPNASVSPSAVAGSTAVPAVTVTAVTNVSPSAVVAVASVPSVTVATGETVSASAVAGVAAVPSPAIATGETVTATAVAGVAAVPAVAVTAVTNVSPIAVAAVAAVPSVVVSTGGGNVNVVANAVAGSAAVPAPSVATGETVAASVVVTSVAIPAPSVATGETVTATAVVATAAIPAPVVTAGSSASVTPAVVSAVASVPAATLSTGSRVTALVVAGSAAVPAPSISTGVRISALAVTAVAAVPGATVGVPPGLHGALHGRIDFPLGAVTYSGVTLAGSAGG